MSNIYISNSRILSKIYSGYQPFPRRWEIDKEGSKATLIFGPNRIELTLEIWRSLIKDIMISEGICSERTKYGLNIKDFSLNPDEVGLDCKGIVVEYSYDVGKYSIS